MVRNVHLLSVVENRGCVPLKNSLVVLWYLENSAFVAFFDSLFVHSRTDTIVLSLFTTNF